MLSYQEDNQKGLERGDKEGVDLADGDIEQGYGKGDSSICGKRPAKLPASEALCSEAWVAM